MTGTADEPSIAEELVRGIHEVVFSAAVDGCEDLITNPPGRQPETDLVEISEWWNALDPTSRERVRQVSAMASDLAVFGFLCVLDNVRKVSDRAGFELRLYAVVDDVEQRIPDDDAVQLHDIFVQLRSEDPGVDSPEN